MTYRTNPRLAYPIYFGTEPHILRLARENRNNPTSAESKLWQWIRQRKVTGMKFRRQHPISGFIVDFYCNRAKLVIEIDGGYHDNMEQYESDQGRQKELEAMGLMVIRFRNEEIDKDVEEVVKKIRLVLQEMVAPCRG